MSSVFNASVFRSKRAVTGRESRNTLPSIPNGRLPAVHDDGFITWESLAIHLYLTKNHSTGSLYPATHMVKPRPGDGVGGRQTRSSAASILGNSTHSGCLLPSAIRRSPLK